jgi:hypothetical protein
MIKSRSKSVGEKKQENQLGIAECIKVSAIYLWNFILGRHRRFEVDLGLCWEFVSLSGGYSFEQY